VWDPHLSSGGSQHGPVPIGWQSQPGSHEAGIAVGGFYSLAIVKATDLRIPFSPPTLCSQ
jgi:hypothetical protein